MLKEIRSKRVFVPKKRPALYDKVEWFRKRDRIAERHLRKTKKRTKKKIFEFLKFVTRIGKFVDKSNKRLLNKAFDGLKVQFVGDDLDYLRAIQHENELLKIKSFMGLKQNIIIRQKQAYFKNIQYKNRIESFFNRVKAKKEEVYYPFKEFHQTLFIKTLLLARRKVKDISGKLEGIQEKKEDKLKRAFINKLRALNDRKLTNRSIKMYFMTFFLRNVVKCRQIREEVTVAQSFKEDKLKAKAFNSLLLSMRNRTKLKKILVSYLKQAKINRIDQILEEYILKKTVENKLETGINTVHNNQKQRVMADFMLKVRKETKIAKLDFNSKKSVLKSFFTAVSAKSQSKMILNSTKTSLSTAITRNILTKIAETMVLKNFFVSREARRRSLFSKIKEESLEKAGNRFNSCLKEIHLKRAFLALKRKKKPNFTVFKLFLHRTKTRISLKSKQKQLRNKVFLSLSTEFLSNLLHFLSCRATPSILNLSKLSSPLCKLLYTTLKTVERDPKRTFFSLLRLLSLKKRLDQERKSACLTLLNKAAQRQKRIKAKIQLEKAKIIKESFKISC